MRQYAEGIASHHKGHPESTTSHFDIAAIPMRVIMEPERELHVDYEPPKKSPEIVCLLLEHHNHIIIAVSINTSLRILQSRRRRIRVFWRINWISARALVTILTYLTSTSSRPELTKLDVVPGPNTFSTGAAMSSAIDDSSFRSPSRIQGVWGSTRLSLT